MSYDSKIEFAHNIIEQHNTNVKENPIDFDNFVKELKKMGGSSEDALKAVSFEDLQECGLPKIMARRVAHLFRKDVEGSSSNTNYISSRRVQMLNPKELIQYYDPKDSDNAVGKRLSEISDNKPFVVFDDRGDILVNESNTILEDIRKGLEPISTYFHNGRPLHVYRVGENPDCYADENPIYTGKALRSGEVCDQTGRSWKGVSQEIRQLLHIAVIETKEIKIETVYDANNILDRVISDKWDFDYFRGRYPNSSKKYDELLKIGRLPLLKIKLGKRLSDKKNNPRIY